MASQMKSSAGPVPPARSPRKPLYAQVVTHPPLTACWSVDLSRSGIGLVAEHTPQLPGPREGEPVELVFGLPGEAESVRVQGDVRWRQEGPPGGRRTTAAMGVSFRSMRDGDAIKLARYLESDPIRVVVAFASARQLAKVTTALSGRAAVEAAASAEAAFLALERGDVTAILVCGDSEIAALALVDGLEIRLTDDELLAPGFPRDLAPRLVYCAPARPERLVDYFNAGRLFRAVNPQLADEAVLAAVLDAYRERGVRTEQRRASLSLARTLHRERALQPAGAAVPSVLQLAGLQSRAMQRIQEDLALVAPHRVAVLLQGETGVGKEVLARSIHRLGGDPTLPFVVQDCGALTETLLESELFGHVKGAFTGAISDHPGLFVLADGGTIFLDEIENTSANLQAKLLRVLETGEVRAVGGTQLRQVNVRVVAASNRDLGAEVDGGRFRRDLFYRLNTFVIDVPPLRARPEDILPLADHFLALFNRKLGRSAAGFTAEVQELLRHAPWPGNLRELRNVLERAVILSRPGEPVTAAMLPESVVLHARRAAGTAGTGDGTLRATLERTEAELIRAALEQHEGVLARAAKALGADPVTLGRKVRKYGLRTGS
jgi:two-component system response regulator HupR/HoxA